jgi:hypothetical protein
MCKHPKEHREQLHREDENLFPSTEIEVMLLVTDNKNTRGRIARARINVINQIIIAASRIWIASSIDPPVRVL